MGLAGVLRAPPGMHKLTVQDGAVLGAGGKHGSAAVMQTCLLTSFASQQCHADAFLLHRVWWCRRYRGELCFMAHSVANACVTMGTVLARSAKTAADPHLEFQVLCPFGKWTMEETARGPKSRHV